MTLPANWQDNQTLSADAQNLTEGTINSLMVCTTSSASTLTLSPDSAAYVFTGSSTASWTLPDVAANTNKVFTLYNRGSANVTVQCAGSDHIYPSDTTLTLLPGGFATLLNDGTYWLKLTSPVTFDAVGAGTETSIAGTSQSYSWSHTAAGNADALVVAMMFIFPGAVVTPTIDVSYGGVSMTQLAFINEPAASSSSGLYFFGLLDPPTGTHDVDVSVTISLSSTTFVTANSASYIGVSGFGTPVTQGGTGTSLSLSVPASSGQMVVQAFTGEVTLGTGITSYNQTSRSSQNSIAGNSGNYPLLLGDAPGESTVGFTAAMSPSNPWFAAGIPLKNK